MYMKTDKELLQDFTTTRNLKPTTIESYTIFIKNYTTQQGASMVELIKEAENEEEQGIRWKNRTLKKKTNTIQNIPVPKLYVQYRESNVQ